MKIAVGKGLCGPENLPVILMAASKLDAVVAGTSNVTDAG
jgi:electron transfer flavoprotein alpha subunit